jgi:hypothetical protein
MSAVICRDEDVYSVPAIETVLVPVKDRFHLFQVRVKSLVGPYRPNFYFQVTHH